MDLLKMWSRVAGIVCLIVLITAINPVPFSSEYDKGCIAGTAGNQTECDQHITYINAYQQTYGHPYLFTPYTVGEDYYLVCYSVGYVSGYINTSRTDAFAEARDNVRNNVSGVVV